MATQPPLELMARLVFFFDFELVAPFNGQVPLPNATQALKPGGNGKDEGMWQNVMRNGGKVVLLLLGLAMAAGYLAA